MEIHGGAEIHSHTACGGDPGQSRWIPERRLWTRGRPGSWQGPAEPWERSSHWGRFPGRASDPVGNPCYHRLCLKGCTSWKNDPHCSSFWRTGMDLGWGSSWRTVPGGKDPPPWAVAETRCDELTATLFSHLPAPLEGEGGAGKERGMGGRCF